MFKKVIPDVLAAIVFIASLVLLRSAPSKTVVAAADNDLRAGDTLVEGDLSLQAMPASAVASDALTDAKLAVGQSLRIDRGQGDILRTSNLGELITLQPDERSRGGEDHRRDRPGLVARPRPKGRHRGIRTDAVARYTGDFLEGHHRRAASY